MGVSGSMYKFVNCYYNQGMEIGEHDTINLQIQVVKCLKT